MSEEFSIPKEWFVGIIKPHIRVRNLEGLVRLIKEETEEGGLADLCEAYGVRPSDNFIKITGLIKHVGKTVTKEIPTKKSTIRLNDAHVYEVLDYTAKIILNPLKNKTCEIFFACPNEVYKDTTKNREIRSIVETFFVLAQWLEEREEELKIEKARLS